MRKTDEEIVRDIMEAGYGYNDRQVGLLGGAAKLGLTAATYGAKKAVKAYKNTDFSKTRQGEKAFQSVWKKLRKDWLRFSSSSHDDEDATRLLIDFGHALYQADLQPFANAVKTAPAASHPEHPPIAPDEILAHTSAAAPAEPAAADEPAPAAEPAPARKPRAKAAGTKPRVVNRSKKSKENPPEDWRPHERLDTYMDREGTRLDARDAEERRAAMAKKNAQKAAESYEGKSFSQIVAEADAADADPAAQEKHRADIAFYRGVFKTLAQYIASSPRRTEAFLKNNQIAGDNQPEPKQTDKAKAKAAPQAAPKAAAEPQPTQPTQPAPTGLSKDTLNAEIGKIATIDGAQIDAIRTKIGTAEGAQALAAFSSPQEIEIAKAIAAAVMKLLT